MAESRGAFRSQFLQTVCQVGAEPALKAEVSRAHPGLRFAYSRPGFVTFRTVSGNDELTDTFQPGWVFARECSLNFGKVRSAQELVEQARRLRGDQPWKWVLHLFERDRHAPGEEPLGYDGTVLERAFREQLGQVPGWSEVFEERDQARAGEPVLSCVGVEEGEWWVGVHRQGPGHSPFPGGRYPVSMPEDSPSRAYLKLEEVLAWSGAPVRRGDTAVEIGSAPGGASYALLRRGVNVVGIDPGAMSPRVLEFRQEPWFAHIQRPVAEVPREELPESVEWLLLDMNVEPRISIFAVDRLATRLDDTLLGLVLTVKLNQWKFAAELPGWLEHVRAMGMVRVKAVQLATHRREICIFGLTRRGKTRFVNA